jgi:hypothetical protein
VRVHAEIGADDRFHVFGPAKSRRVDDAFHALAGNGGSCWPAVFRRDAMAPAVWVPVVSFRERRITVSIGLQSQCCQNGPTVHISPTELSG